MSLVALIAALLLTLLPPHQAQAQGGALDEIYSDVVLVIDHSGSMEENDPQFLRLAAAKLFIDLADPRDKIGIVVMSDKGRTRPLTKRLTSLMQLDGVRELKQQIDGLRNERMGEETHMGTALAQAHDLLASTDKDRVKSNQRQFVVLLTDGKPTGDGQFEKVDAAVSRIQERRYWRIFSIALGANAAPDYLQQAVAAPTGASVVVANQANELIDSYLEVYTRAGDDRYVDRVTVDPNTLASLARIELDHQPTHLAVVLVRGDPKTSISRLLAPDERDIIKPYYQNTVQRGAEPEYELYKIPPEAQVNLVGDWKINVAHADQTPMQVVVLTRSRLRMRMPVPAPILSEDDNSLRYHPLGRPLLLVAGAEVARRNRETIQRTYQPYVYQWVDKMSPAIRAIAPTEGPLVTLTDDGRVYDTVAGDGRYSALYPAFTSEGDYTLQLEAPHQTDTPIHVTKPYVVRVTSLPTMTLTLPPAATLLPIHTAFDGLVDLHGRADFSVERVDFPAAWVTRPDGVLDPLTLTPAEDGRFRFTYTPEFDGAYRVSVAAEVHGRGPMGDIRYVDFVDAQFAAPKVVPAIYVTAAFTDTLTYGGRGVVEVPMTIDSRSAKAERLQVQVDGVPGGRVVPEELLVEPNERVQRTVAVWLPKEDRPKRGQFTLTLSAPDQQVRVEGSRIDGAFREKLNLMLPLLLVLAVGIAVGAFFYYRRRRKQRVQALLALSAPRRFE
jgi:uncharacterized protein YegL